MFESQRLLDAVVAVTSDLDLQAVLHRIVIAACELSDAQYGALGVLGSSTGDDGNLYLTEFIPEGIDDEAIRNIAHYPEGKGILGVLIRDPKPLRLHDLHAHPQSVGFPENHPPMKSFLGVPIRIREHVYGNLYLTEKRGGVDFTAQDEELVVGLAAAAGVAIENAALHTQVKSIAVLQDRERIARDLHDTVIQRLFATGLSLQGLARSEGDSALADRIQKAVDELDDTIRDIRGAIFALQAHERGEKNLPVMILALCTELAPTIGIEPKVHLDGPVDTAINDRVGGQLLTALRELLINVGKHAHASTVEVFVKVGVDISLRVVDNGVGLAKKPGKGNGLRNLRERARLLGGEFEVKPGESKGTVATWTIPRELHRADS